MADFIGVAQTVLHGEPPLSLIWLAGRFGTKDLERRVEMIRSMESPPCA